MHSKLLFLLSFFCFTQSAWAILPIQHWQTSNGARVYFVENRDILMIDLSIDFAAGNAYDTAARKGVASMTNRIMRLGAEGLTEDDIARKTADIGAGISGRFDSDRAGLAMRTLSSRAELDQALDVYTRILHKPLFPQPAFEREKTRLLGSLKESDIQPGTIAGVTFNRLMYGTHSYGLRASGGIESVGKITRDDLVQFYQRHYGARNAVIAIMGDVSRNDATAIAERIAAGLPKADAASTVPTLPPVEAKAEKVTRLIAHHATQSHILIGTIGIARSDPDYFPLFVGNYVLGGGGFDSRILNEIRQKRGLAYSAYSYFMPLKQPGPFQIGMQTKKQDADTALKVARETLVNFIKTGPTAEELKQAKNNIILGFPLRIDTNREILEYLGVIGFYDLPLSYLDDFTHQVDKVTAREIQDAFKRHVDPDKMATVIVGGPEEK